MITFAEAAQRCQRLGEKLREARKRRDLTPTVAASRAGLSLVTVAMIEQGLDVATQQVIAYADSLECDLALIPRGGDAS